MSNQYIGAIAVVFAVVAFILWVLAISEEFAWIPVTSLDNISAPEMAVFGVLAAAGAVGAYKAGV